MESLTFRHDPDSLSLGGQLGRSARHSPLKRAVRHSKSGFNDHDSDKVGCGNKKTLRQYKQEYEKVTFALLKYIYRMTQLQNKSIDRVWIHSD